MGSVGSDYRHAGRTSHHIECDLNVKKKGSEKALSGQMPLIGHQKKSLLIPHPPPSLSPSHPIIPQRQAMNQCGQIMEADQHISKAQDRSIQIVKKNTKPKYQNVLDFLEYLEETPGAVLRENNSEHLPAPPTENPNRVKPDAKNASNVWTGLLDDHISTTNTDQDTNISLDNAGVPTNAVNFPHPQENNPEAVPVSPNQNSNNEALKTNATNESLNSTSENTENVSYAAGTETETEVSSANPNAVKPLDSIVFAKWGSITIDVPSTGTTKYNGTINVDISVDERYLTVNGNAPTIDYSQQELITSEESLTPKETHSPEETLASEETQTSKETLTPEETLINEEIPTNKETPTSAEEDKDEDSTQEMLDPHFESQLHVTKDQESALYTIKINQLVQLTILPNFNEVQNVLIGIYHSHPEYVDKIISGVDSKQPPTSNDTPFSISDVNGNNVIYKNFIIHFMKIKMKGALVKLPTGINKIPLKFHLTSTNPNNYGDVKEGKEWHLLVIPISKNRAEEISNSIQEIEITREETIPSSKLRIQVTKETRKNKVLKKGHRNIEVPWPIQQTAERKLLELQYIQAIKRKMLSESNEELKQKVAKLY